MKRTKTFVADLTVLGLILVAFLCRVSWLLRCPYYLQLGYLRSVIHIAVFLGWGIDLSRRVVQPRVRRQLMNTAWLMVFWITVRTVKNNFVEDPYWTHWLWYLFYLPIIWIPTLSVFISEALCKPESHRPPKRMQHLLIPAFVLLALVLTNDLHHWVFIFPADGPKYPKDGYGYGIAWYAVMLWVGLCALFSFTVILKKSRIPGTKKRILVPAGILLLLAAYNVLYILNVPFIKVWLNDMTIMICLLLMAAYESCFRLNLIHTNNRYSELFEHSAIPVCIMDDGCRVLRRSAGYRPLSQEETERAKKAPFIADDGVRISSAPIRIGRVLWQEDLTALLDRIRDLEDTRERLEGSNMLAAEEYRTRLLQQQLVERNRMYDRMQEQTAPRVRELRALVEALGAETDRAAAPGLAKRIGVLGAYIKRRNNLILLSENQSVLPAAELKYCLRESLQNLTAFGISAEQYFALEGTLPFEDLVALYDGFEQVLEAAPDNLTDLFVSVTSGEDGPVLSMRVHFKSLQLLKVPAFRKRNALYGSLNVHFKSLPVRFKSLTAFESTENEAKLHSHCKEARTYISKACGFSVASEEPGEWLVTVSVPNRGGAEQ